MTLNSPLLIAFILVSHAALAQVKVPERLIFPSPYEMEEYKEYPEDEYVPAARESMATSPAYRISGPSFTSVQVNVNQAGENIVGDAANEPSIAVSPADPSRMAIGWRQFDQVSSNFRQAGFAYSGNGGASWVFPGVIEPGVFRSDPVLDTDSEGTFYYNSLSTNGGDYFCDVYKSAGVGAWDAGTAAFGGDKQWMAVDRTGGATDGNIYAYWNQFFSICPEGMFTRSTDGGLSYDPCVTVPQQPVWGTLAVGPDGEVYACGTASGTGRLVVAKSANAGNPGEPPVWDFVTEVNLDGQQVAFSDPNPAGLLGQVWIGVDHSEGAARGNLYLLCSVSRFSTQDVLDVMFARSTDGGLTWSDPVRINDDNDPGAYQWFGTMAVAPNGRIDAVWLDTRDDPGGRNSSLYHSFSDDGGLSWNPNERLSESFDPHAGWPNQQKMGDYFDMQSDENGAHLAWAATFNGEQDVYYGFIPFDGITRAEGPEIEEKPLFSLAQNFPNPFGRSTSITYALRKKGRVLLEVYNQLGQPVAVLENGERPAGEYTLAWDGRDDQGALLPNGAYFYRLAAGEGSAVTRRMVVLR